MIAGATRGKGGRALASHLTSRRGQTSELVDVRHLGATTTAEALAELVAGSAHGRTDRPVHHLHVDPPHGWDRAEVRDAFLRRYEAEFGLTAAPRFIQQHGKGDRTHWHVVYSLVRDDGRCVSLSHDMARREKVCRITEFETGMPMVRGAHTKAVTAALIGEGRQDVARAILQAGHIRGPRPIAVTPRERHQAERTSINPCTVQTAALTAWRASDTGASFEAALAAVDLRLAAGGKGAVVIDAAGGAHSLSRILGAASRADGARIGAAAVKARVAVLHLPPISEVQHAIADTRRHPVEAPAAPAEAAPSRSNPPRSEGSARNQPQPSAAPEPPRGARGLREPRRDQDASENHRHDLGSAVRDAARDQGQRSRWTESDRAAVAALRRINVTGIRADAEAIRLRPIRRSVHDHAAALALSRIDIGTLADDAQRILVPATAGSIFTHPESQARRDSTMAVKRFGPTGGKQDYKTRLLEGAVPGFDASGWVDDLHMVKAGGPSTPTRILTRDRGWVEIDRKAGVVRTWGPVGRAETLAKELAAAGGWDIERLVPAGEARRVGVTTPRPTYVSPHMTESLVTWWRERGYDATPTPDGAWVDAGGAHLHDTGDHVELHGHLSPEAARAIILKASEAWDGGAELSGPWSRADRDTLWLEAPRAGVELHGCQPSDGAQRVWEAEVRKAKEHDVAVGLVRAGSREAETLRSAAAGDIAALGKLSPELRAFVSSYLDDDQRRELAEAEPVDLIPELRRFRSLGAEELTMRRLQPDPEQVSQASRDKPEGDDHGGSDLVM